MVSAFSSSAPAFVRSRRLRVLTYTFRLALSRAARQSSAPQPTSEIKAGLLRPSISESRSMA